ncbi:hypothetical protein A2706_02335 [Candidatus Peribacteria bacterium RIFCSPHIGHO2_01_FULL_51_35]|nr:MAG: hypothetical protein A2706_02335 [Candidatus Peribacteria bacterium RIFCSPHIGHO2_01_FULL_51_35]
MSHRFPIFWLTGNSGAGKTTLAEDLERHFNVEMDTRSPAARRVIVLDGNAMRETISTDASFTPEDRRNHNLRVARLAAHLQSRGFLVIVSVIAPFTSVRCEIDELCSPMWIYVKRSGLETRGKPYEEPVSPNLTIDHNELNPEEALTLLQAFVLGRITPIKSGRPDRKSRVEDPLFA